MSIEQEVRTQTLNEAIRRIEGLHGNEKYHQAWKRAADALRSRFREEGGVGTISSSRMVRRARFRAGTFFGFLG